METVPKPKPMEAKSYRLPEWAIELAKIIGGDASTGIRIALSGIPLMVRTFLYLKKMQGTDPRASRLHDAIGKHYAVFLPEDTVKTAFNLHVINEAKALVSWEEPSELSHNDPMFDTVAQISKHLGAIEKDLKKQGRDRLIAEQVGAIVQAINNLAAAVERP
jgi:hypothetical protein